MKIEFVPPKVKVPEVVVKEGNLVVNPLTPDRVYLVGKQIRPNHYEYIRFTLSTGGAMWTSDGYFPAAEFQLVAGKLTLSN